MPSNQKAVSIHTFTGGIDSTTARELVSPDTAAYILNCHSLSTAEGNVGIITNVKGNLKISVALHAGVNETIGHAIDEERNRFIYFVWNSLGYHCILQFNSISRIASKIMESITDTNGVDILNFSNAKQYRINMANINIDNLYWVDGGLNKARKLNIAMALDKTSSGYGPIIYSQDINAFKAGPTEAPVVSYFSNTALQVNKLYGSLRKFVYRFVYKGGEKSDYSDFSDVATPQKESFTGVNVIPSDNNGMHVTIQTGGREVFQIELAMETTLEADGVVSDWLIVATLNKSLLGIANDSTFTYDFYNDGKYGVVDNLEKIIRPYNYLPDRPKCQSLVRGSMLYANFKQGWPTFPLNVTHVVNYAAFSINTGITTKMNSPQLIVALIPGSNVTIGGGDTITRVDGSTVNNGAISFKRNSGIKITVGPDVKAGNIFSVGLGNGNVQDEADVSYTALVTDTPSTVATQLANKLIAINKGTGAPPFVVYRQAGSGPSYDIYSRITSSDGSISFQFNIGAYTNAGYIGNNGSSVNPVSYQTLNDTGQSLKNMKLGDTRQWGFVYWDEDGRKSATYTNTGLIIPIASINELNGYKTPVIHFEIFHQPPVWATRWQFAVSESLVYDDFIQMLIQKVITVPDTGQGQYLDLVVGSLFTYQKIHEGTTLKYEFIKGDRLRLIRDQNEQYYPFFETEIISYMDSVDNLVNESVIIGMSDEIIVKLTDASNIGRFIQVNNTEREITEVIDATHYRVNAPYGITAETFPTYHIIDRRGTVRIRKPAVEIRDLSMVEIYNTASKFSGTGSRKFYLLNPSYLVLQPGTAARAHQAPNFNQEIATNQPGVADISNGNIYIRNREEPITNNVPGAQTRIEVVEDPSYSDFYSSLMNDFGKISVEDTGDGEVNFGSRIRFSNNFIEDTKINGLNDFDNLDRKDYNDQFGDIKLLKLDGNTLLIFKELRDASSPVYGKLIQDKDGQTFLGTSSELLGDINYFAWEGGIGNDPESFASNGTMKYHVSVNSGIIARIGGDGITPLSQIYNLDNEVRAILKSSSAAGAKMIGGVDRKNGEYILAIRATSTTPAYTLAFNENANKFVSYYSYSPEDMIKYKDEFFAFDQGNLWEQDVNPLRNNFFGVQYTSKISFYVNLSPTQVKDFFSMRQKSNSVWTASNEGDIYIYPMEGKPNGQTSRLKLGRFKRLLNDYFADFLRDMNDPRFTDKNEALMNGALLQGGVMKITLENNNTAETRLLSVDITTSVHNYSY